MELLNYKIYGQGPGLIILHGFLGSGENWSGVAKLLADQYEVITVDLRNHGKSFHSPDHTYEKMVDDLVYLIETLNIDKCHLLGHSMGGKTAMTFAGKRPELIDKLVIVEMSPKAYGGGQFDILEALGKIDVETLKDRGQAEELLEPLVRNKAIRQFLLKGLYRKDDHTFGWRFNLKTLLNQYDNLLGMPPFKIPFKNPVLFIKGGKSDYIGTRDINLIRKIFPAAKLSTITEAGHWPHFERRDEFMLELTQFLGS